MAVTTDSHGDIYIVEQMQRSITIEGSESVEQIQRSITIEGSGSGVRCRGQNIRSSQWQNNTTKLRATRNEVEKTSVIFQTRRYFDVLNLFHDFSKKITL